MFTSKRFLPPKEGEKNALLNEEKKRAEIERFNKELTDYLTLVKALPKGLNAPNPTVPPAGPVLSLAGPTASSPTEPSPTEPSPTEPSPTTTEPDRALVEPDRALAEPDRALAEPDRALAESDRALAESDRALAELDRALAELDQALAELDRTPKMPAATSVLPHVRSRSRATRSTAKLRKYNPIRD
jgi:hypothetical protein